MYVATVKNVKKRKVFELLLKQQLPFEKKLVVINTVFNIKHQTWTEIKYPKKSTHCAIWAATSDEFEGRENRSDN